MMKRRMNSVMVCAVWVLAMVALAPGQTPTENVRKVMATDAITEDLDFLTGRTLTVGSGATLTYSTGASFAGDSAEFRTDIGLGTAATRDTGSGSGQVPLLGIGGVLSLAGAVEAQTSVSVFAAAPVVVLDPTGSGVATIGVGSLTTTRAYTLPDRSGVFAIVADAGGLVDVSDEITGRLPNANLATMAQATIKGRASGAGTGDATDLSADQVSTILDGATDPFVRTSAGGSGATLGANTFTRLQTITQGTANEGVIASTGYSLTGSNAQNMIDLAGTWNTTGVPTAIKLNITNTASGAGSKLLDLQVGGSSKFFVDTDGYLNFPFTGGLTRFMRAGASSGGGQLQMLWGETESYGVLGDANSNFFFRFGRGVCAVDGTLGYSAADSALSPDTYLKRRAASVIGIEGASSAGGILEFLQAASGGTPSSNSARIYAKDVSGTAEVFVKDEAGNETQISPHNHTAPAALVDNAFDEIGFSANVYTGVVQYVNQQRKAKGRPDYLYVETFAEHNARLGLAGGAALVQLDWATVQAAKVVERDALRAAWQTRKAEWESNPANEGKVFPESEPPVLVAKPVPAWLTAQLSARDTYLAGRDAVEQQSADRATKRAAVGNAVTGLRTWASDAQTATNNWDGWTQTQKNAAMKTVITRFGILCDRMADMIEAQGLDVSAN
jgi:hypothetical protein